MLTHWLRRLFGDAPQQAPRTQRRSALGVERLEDRANPASFRADAFIVTAADAGAPPEVRILDPNTGSVISQFLAFDGSFRGGVRVTVGDFDGDELPDLAVAAGPGGGPIVRVFRGYDAAELTTFNAYPTNGSDFTGGLFLASADLDGDGRDEIITGTGAGGGPIVRAFDGTNGQMTTQFLAYAPSFVGGVRVAAGDVDGNGLPEIITAAGYGGGPHIQIWGATRIGDYRSVGSFFAYAPSFINGLYVTTGDVNGDGIDEIITGAGIGGGPHVRVMSGFNGDPYAGNLESFFAYDASFTGGVRVAAADLNGDGAAEIITTPGPGGGSIVRVFEESTASELSSLPAFAANMFTGLQVDAGVGYSRFPLTPTQTIEQAYRYLQYDLVRNQRNLAPANQITIVNINNVNTAYYGYGLYPPFWVNPWFYDAPALYWGMNFFYAPDFYTDVYFFDEFNYYYGADFVPDYGYYDPGFSTVPYGYFDPYIYDGGAYYIDPADDGGYYLDPAYGDGYYDSGYDDGGYYDSGYYDDGYYYDDSWAYDDSGYYGGWYDVGYYDDSYYYDDGYYYDDSYYYDDGYWY